MASMEEFAARKAAEMKMQKFAEKKLSGAMKPNPSFEVESGGAVSGLDPTQNSDIIEGAKNLNAFQRSILVDPLKSRAKALAEKIPADLTSQISPAIPVNVPVRSAARVVADAGPEFLDAKNLALTFLGGPAMKVAGTALEESAVGAVAKAVGGKAWEAVPLKLKKWLTYRFGQPEAYKQLVEETGVAKGIAEEEARDLLKVGTKGLSRGEQADTITLPDGSTAKNFVGGQQRRLDQIVKGSISTNPGEADLRARAAQIRGKLDSAENAAKDVGLLGARTNETRAGRALTREKVEKLRARAAELRANGAMSADWRAKTINAAGNVDVKGLDSVEAGLAHAQKKVGDIQLTGQQKLRSQIDEARTAREKTQFALGDAQDALEGEDFKMFEDLMQDETLRRNKGVQRILDRYQKGSVGDKEKLMTRLRKVAANAGAKIDDIDTGAVSIAGKDAARQAIEGVDLNKVGVSGVKQIISRIEQASGRFPGRSKIIGALEGKAQSLQDDLVSHYTESGMKYVPRKYLEDLADTAQKGMAFSGNRLRLDRFKGRELIDPTIRKAKGELVQPGYSASTGYAETMRAVHQEKMFQSIAKNPELATENAEHAAQKGFVQIPDVPSFGSLRNKWVQPDVADDLNQLTMKDSDAWKMMKSVSRLWKFNMVVMNPATRGRNIMTNSALLDMSGTGYLTQARLLPKAVKEMVQKGEIYQLAKEHGAIGTEFVGGEMQAFRQNLLGAQKGGLKGATIKAKNVVSGVGNSIAKGYQNEEQVFKLVKFMDGLKKGMEPSAAAAQARKWMIDYGAVPPAIEKLRNSPIGLPFVTFTYKAIPLVVETALTNPMKLYKYAILARSSNKLAKEDAGLNDKEMSMVTKDSKVALPGGKKDAVQTVDFGFLNPLGGLMSGEALPGYKKNLPSAVRPSGWGMAFINLADNYNSFTGKPIWDDTDSPELKRAKATNFLEGALLPSLTPGAGGLYSPARGGRGFREIRDSIKGKPTYPNRDVKTKAQAAASLVGLKTQTVNPREEIVKELKAKKGVASQNNGQIRGMFTHPGASDAEKKRYLKEKIDATRSLFTEGK